MRREAPLETKVPALEGSAREQATQRKEPWQANSTAQADRSASPQARGQLRRAAECDLLATRAERAGRWPEARKLRHEAHELRRLARGPRLPEIVLDVELALAGVRLTRWAGRAA